MFSIFFVMGCVKHGDLLFHQKTNGVEGHQAVAAFHPHPYMVLVGQRAGQALQYRRRGRTSFIIIIFFSVIVDLFRHKSRTALRTTNKWLHSTYILVALVG